MSKTILFANIRATNYCIFETQGGTVACDPPLATMLLHQAQPHALSFLPHYASQVWAWPRSQPVPVASWGCRASGVPSTIRPSPEPQDGCPGPASIPEGAPPPSAQQDHPAPCHPLHHGRTSALGYGGPRESTLSWLRRQGLKPPSQHRPRWPEMTLRGFFGLLKRILFSNIPHSKVLL